MRRAFTIVMTLVMLCALTACSGQGGQTSGASNTEGISDTSGNSANSGDSGTSSSFPEKNITMIIPQGLGGGSDLIARTLASELEKILGVSVICENVDGGSTSIGLQQLVDSDPDGYTVSMTMTNLATLNALGYSTLTCDDFAPICSVNYDAATIMIRTNETRFTDLESLVAYSKEHPGELNWGTGAAGGMWHLAILTLFNAAGIDGNIVPNSGGGTGVGLALENGDIDVAVFSPVDCMAQIDAGTIHPIVSMTEERMKSFSDVPTAAECGYEITTLSTRGYVAPKGTPEDVIAVLEDAFKQAVESEGYQSFIESMASNVYWQDADDYYTFMKSEVDQYVPLLEQAGLAQG